MKKIHVTAIALLLAFAAVFGTFAATRTASLGSASRQAATASYDEVPAARSPKVAGARSEAPSRTWRDWI